ncbi:MAG: polysaccharide deacetylase family protein [Treponema sp.]|jgi:peptidoglycan/xylan/chitin deacetylase (PgdA/CDA1 family)|nr:polysaccharide deacetylase family protein [Treponema sp.]
MKNMLLTLQTAVSKTAPVANPPQFVVLGSDDNTKAKGIEWMSNVISSGRNKDGSRMYMSFYMNTDQGCAIWDIKNDLVDAAYNAYKAGHEIGNHTSTHLYIVAFGEIDEYGADTGRRADYPAIKAEIQRAENVLIASGIPKEHIVGFRTPYLRYSNSTFRAVKEFGFLYDCSVCAAYDNAAGDNYFPYTLDGTPDENGNYAPDNSAGRNPYGKTTVIRKHEGLWELPCARIKIAPEDIAYAEKNLKQKYGGGYKFDGYITGLDWDLWADAKMDSSQTVRSLMHTLKESLKGNRAPFTVGVHSPFYVEPKNSDFPNITQEQRRWAFEEFVRQASRLDDVFFVSADMVIRWMQNPVSAAEFNPENYRRAPYPRKTAPSKIRLSNNSVDEGVLEIGELTAVNLNLAVTHTFSVVEGCDVFGITGNKLKFKSAQNPNMNGYDVCVKAQADENTGSVEQRFKIWVDRVFNTDVELVNTGDWTDEKDNIGSSLAIASHSPLKASLKLAAVQNNKDGSVSTPFVSTGKTYEYALSGLKNIEVVYTCDREAGLNISFGKRNMQDNTAKFSFVFSALLPASAKEKSVILTPDMFEMIYSQAADEADILKIPGSLKDALWLKGLTVSFAGIDENKTTNIEVFSLKLRGVPGNPNTPEKNQ